MLVESKIFCSSSAFSISSCGKDSDGTNCTISDIAVSALNIEEGIVGLLEEAWRVAAAAAEDGVRGAILARKLELISPMPMKKSSTK